MRIQTPPGFGSHKNCFTALFLHLCDQTLAPSIAIHIRRIDKIHAHVNRFVERSNGFGVVNITPRPPNSPRSETYFGNLPAGPAKFTVSHQNLSLTKCAIARITKVQLLVKECYYILL
jgi:hypothetical protein